MRTHKAAGHYRTEPRNCVAVQEADLASRISSEVECPPAPLSGCPHRLGRSDCPQAGTVEGHRTDGKVARIA